MRILLVANYEPDQQQSMQRYASWLLGALRSRSITTLLIRPVPFFSKLAIGPLRNTFIAKYLGYLDKYWMFPRQLKNAARNFDLVHILDHSNSMYLKAAGETKTVITCHDVLEVRSALGEFETDKTRGHRTKWTGRQLQAWILRGLRNATNVICVSHKTASDLQRLTGNPTAHIEVILNPLNWPYKPQAEFPSTLRERLNLNPDQPYFLHVGGNQWYKNRPAVLRIFSELTHLPEYSTAKLIMAGKPFPQSMRNLLHELALEDRVTEATNLTNEDLQSLYSHAEAVIFPSLEEGFGWPIAEAQACGCPVATTNREPMTEVAGPAGVLIDPTNPNAATEAIRQGLRNRQSLIEAGLQNATRFNSELIATQYAAFYAAILNRA